MPAAPGGTMAGQPDAASSVASPRAQPNAAAAQGTSPAATPATGSTSAMISPPDVSLRVGQSAGVAVLLVGAKDVQWVEVVLAVDSTLVQVAESAPGALMTLDGQPVQTERQVEGGRARVRFARTTPVSGSGAVLAVTLRGLRPGSGTVAVQSLTIGHAGGAAESAATPAPARVAVAP